MGQALAERNMTLVYGGGRVGLMGAVADSVLAPRRPGYRRYPRLSGGIKSWPTWACTELHMVKSMHERKLLMADLADGFVAMPGGYGTLEELFEVLTWGQLGLAPQARGRAQCGRLLRPAIGACSIRWQGKGCCAQKTGSSSCRTKRLLGC